MEEILVAERIQIRRDIASEWATVNPILAVAELGYETDTQKLKIGDAVTAWNDLDYFPAGGGGGLRFGIEDVLGVQDRAMDMQGYSLVTDNLSSWSAKSWTDWAAADRNNTTNRVSVSINGGNQAFLYGQIPSLIDDGFASLVGVQMDSINPEGGEPLETVAILHTVGTYLKHQIKVYADKITIDGRYGYGAPNITKLLIKNLPIYADEAAASSLDTDQIYKTSTGELRIKL